ncbi:hypothetical protein TNCV_1261071 [Trichonephila clavipes]|nr:hypothetical protein TNCV_1261071 [Trichonephila clavipes]
MPLENQYLEFLLLEPPEIAFVGDGGNKFPTSPGVASVSTDHCSPERVVHTFKPPILREKSLWEGVRGLQLTSREDMRLNCVPPCHIGTVHLETSVSSLGFEIRFYVTAVSVNNHNIGWLT